MKRLISFIVGAALALLPFAGAVQGYDGLWPAAFPLAETGYHDAAEYPALEIEWDNKPLRFEDLYRGQEVPFTKAYLPHGISVTNIDMQFTTGSFLNCTIAACFQVVRASPETCTWGDGHLTYVTSNVGCETDLGYGSTWQGSTNALQTASATDLTTWSTFTGGGTIAVTTAAAGTAPDNVGSASLVVVSRTAGGCFSQTAATFGHFTSTNATWTGSLYVKAQAGADIGKVINVGIGDAIGNAYTIDVTLTSSYQRIIATGSLAANAYNGSGGGPSINIGFIGNSPGCNPQTGTVNILAWGGQPEASAVATPLILATGAGPLARAPDDTRLIANAATMLNNSVGTTVVTTNSGQLITAATLIGANTSILIGQTNTNQLTTTINTPLATGNAAVWTGSVVSGIGWDGTGRSLQLAGGALTSDTVATIPTGTFHLGSTDGTTGFANRYITRLQIWPTRNIAPPPPVGSIDLNFASSIFTGCTVTGCLSVARNLAGSYAEDTLGNLVSFAANTLRFTNRGSLYESPSTNYVLWSNDLTNVVWGSFNTVVTGNVDTAPDGTVTADKIIENTTANQFHLLGQTIVKSAVAQTWTCGSYVKPSPRNVMLQIGDGSGSNGVNATFILSGGGSTSGVGAFGSGMTSVSATITPSANGFYRITSTVVTNATTALSPTFYTANGTTLQYTGDGTSGVIAWGTQCELARTRLSSQINTTTGTVLRPGDVVQPTNALLTLVSGAAGVVIGSISPVNVSLGTIMSRNGATDTFLVTNNSTLINARRSGGVVAQAFSGSLPYFANGAFNVGSSWSAGAGISTVANGGVVATDAGTYGGTINSFIGSTDGTTGYLEGYIQELSFNNAKPSDSTLRVLVPAVGATICQFYHVDPAGSDSNDGCTTATPWQTIAKVNAGNFAGGNQILFKGTQSFTGCLRISLFTNVSAPSASSPIIVDSYGTGTATILGNCSGIGNTDAVVYLDAASGLTVRNLSINGNGNTIGAGIIFENTSSNTMDTLTLTNLDITGFQTGTTTVAAAGIFGVGFSSNGLCSNIVNINITNNNIHGHTNSPTDPEASGYNGYACISGTLPATSTLDTMLFQGNILANMGGMSNFPNLGNGLIPNGAHNVTMQFNVAHDLAGNQTNACGGGAGLWVNNSDATLNRFSEVYNVQAFPTKPVPTGCDWGGAEFDNGTTNSTIEYFYTHHNAGPGFFGTTNGLDARGWGFNTTRYTVSDNDNLYTDDGGGSYAFDSSSNPWWAYNNVAWTPATNSGNTSATSCWTYGFNGTPFNSASVVPANSICVSNMSDQFGRVLFLDTDNAANLGSATLDYNLYYNPSDPTGVTTGYRWYGGATTNNLAAFQASSGKEAHGIAATNPQLTSGGVNQTCTWTPSTQATWPPAVCPTGYVLSTTASAAIGVGVDLTVSPWNLIVGTRDYYANTTPSGHGTGYNLGADGGFP